jgi:hypothetical protein
MAVSASATFVIEVIDVTDVVGISVRKSSHDVSDIEKRKAVTIIIIFFIISKINKLES